MNADDDRRIWAAIEDLAHHPDWTLDGVDLWQAARAGLGHRVAAWLRPPTTSPPSDWRARPTPPARPPRPAPLPTRGDLWTPFVHHRWSRTLDLLLACRLTSTPRAGWLPPPRPHGWAHTRCHAARDRLRQLDLDLQDLPGWIAEVSALARHLQTLSRILTRCLPRLVITHTDAFGPFALTVEVARELGIPTLNLAHGLDCDPHIHEHPRARTHAVWGPARARRLADAGLAHDTRIVVTGDPERDDARPPTSLRPPGHHWLWLTRPHGPAKCHNPSRHPHEGLRIFDALLRTLADHPDAHLVVRLHPADPRSPYAARLLRDPARARVRLDDRTPLARQLAHADLVWTEDSSACLDAILAGRALILTHFAAAPPVVDLVAAHAAWPAQHPDALRDAAARALQASPTELDTQHRGQRAVLHDQLRLDGQASARLGALIHDL